MTDKFKALTLSNPCSHPCELKVEDKYIKSCLNLKPSFRMSGETNASLSNSQIEGRGMEDKSSRKTTESSDSTESLLSWQASWRRETVGKDDWWVRMGFHSASSAMILERVRDWVKSVNSGESVDETRWILRGLGYRGSMEKVELVSSPTIWRRLGFSWVRSFLSRAWAWESSEL